jgi:2-amino-4-hydroxy-6-hydroxymethyldihydropteridine diphosphokinase
MARVRAYVGLGSNLEDPVAQVRRALQELCAVADTRCGAQSSLYRSARMDPAGQPDYINAVAALDTGLDPERLLDALQAIERAHGRVRGPQRWGPRTLDLDLLLYGDAVIEAARLRVPHPGLHQRAFVLLPLQEIAPGELEVPGHGRLADLVARCPGEGISRIEPSA